MPSITLSFDLKGKNYIVLQKAWERLWSRILNLAGIKIKERLQRAVVTGEASFPAFTQTDAWRWITSSEGLGQLGLTSLDQVDKLLEAVKLGVSVRLGKEGRRKVLLVNIFNLAIIARMTPHPARGTSPSLKIESWFIDWIYEQDSVNNRGFVLYSKFLDEQKRRGRGSRTTPRSIEIAGTQTGFMLPAGFSGSKGSWSVPASLRSSIDQWVSRLDTGVFIILRRELKNAMRTI